MYVPLLGWSHGEGVGAVKVVVPGHRAGGERGGSGASHGQLEWRVDGISGGGSSALYIHSQSSIPIDTSQFLPKRISVPIGVPARFRTFVVLLAMALKRAALVANMTINRGELEGDDVNLLLVSAKFAVGAEG